MRKFTIDISKYEYCEGKTQATVDGYLFYVNPPPIIAIEKLRAICQQMPEYQARLNPAPRPRDFYDIHAVITITGCDLSLPTNTILIEKIFSAKEVPLLFLGKIVTTRDFHAQAWSSVENTVRGTLHSFDFYFDFVCDEVRRLQSLWDK
jgi:hypothetical protein